MVRLLVVSMWIPGEGERDSEVNANGDSGGRRTISRDPGMAFAFSAEWFPRGWVALDITMASEPPLNYGDFINGLAFSFNGQQQAR